jgi:hypothetical protein
MVNGQFEKYPSDATFYLPVCCPGMAAPYLKKAPSCSSKPGIGCFWIASAL